MVDQHPHGGHDIVLDPNNANVGTVRGRGMVERSLSQYGAGRSILISADDVALAGNKTLETARELGIPVKVIESDGTTLYAIKRTDLPYDDPRARELAIADNRAAEVGLEWSAEVLAQFQDEGLDIEQFWFPDELAELLAMSDDGTEGLTDPDDVPAVPDEPITKPGDLWLLGEHRLLCGDSTVVTDVDRLMAGRKADMCFTDPPYGVNYEGGHFHSGDVNIVRKREKLAADSNDEIYADVIPIIAAYTDGPCYTFYAGTKPLAIYTTILQCGELHSLLIWHKTNATYAAMNAQYKQRHEPFLYWKPKGSTLRWCGATTEATIWELDRDGQNTYHPTQKPVSLATKAINNHNAEVVLDLFLGSGSTLIACEQTGRRCYGMEISPAYCDVIVRRWEEFTGQTATREQVEG